jgi:hypothetical protein
MGGFSINKSPEDIQKQLDIINDSARKSASDQDASDKQSQRNADVANVKSNMYQDDSGNIVSRQRGLGPSIAKNRLDKSGVDTESLITGKPSANEGYKRGGHVQKQHEKISLKHCKTNTAEHGNPKHKHCW